MNNIAVFCGSSPGNVSAYSEDAKRLANALSNAGITLIYGGAQLGLMGVIADQMLENNSRVIGVIPKSLTHAEIVHKKLTELHIANSMHERKALMESLADGFIMLPGGTGTLEEFFEMHTWAQIGYHNKPCAILNTNGYYDHLLTFLDHAVSQGFLKPSYRDMVIVDQDPRALINKLIAYQAPVEEKWVSQPMSSALVTQ